VCLTVKIVLHDAACVVTLLDLDTLQTLILSRNNAKDSRKYFVSDRCV